MAKFNGYGGGNMQSMMRQAQKLQEEIQNAQAKLQSTEFTGSAGELVQVVLTGDKNLVSVSIKPEAVDVDDMEMLEDLIAAAFQDAYSKIEEESAKIMGPYAGMLGGLM